VVELWAPLDVESPRPGDRSVVWSRMEDDALAIEAPQRVTVRADLVDLDQLGLVVDRIARETGGPPALTVRVDQHQPLVLEHDPAGGLRVRPTVVDGRDRSFSFVTLPLATVLGAFGSRTVAGVTAQDSGRMRVTFIDDLGEGGVREHSLSGDELPPLSGVQGELAVGSVAGLSVFLLPYGASEPVHAIYTAGSTVRVVPLPQLHCDSVALVITDALDALPLACTLDGQVLVGTLTATPELPG
jgi:hypothetical protein